VRDDGAANVSFESSPARPGASGEPERTFENRDACFDAGAEIPEFLIDPAALDHLQDRDPFALGEGHVGEPSLLGLCEVIPGGKAAIGSYLAGRSPVQLLLPLKPRQEHGRICRVTALDHTVDNQTGVSSNNEQLVLVSGFPVSLFDDVRMGLEKGDHFLVCRNLLAFHHSPPGLVHHPIKNTDGFQSIAFDLQCDLKKIPVTTLPNRLLPGVKDFQHALLHHPAVIGKPVWGNGVK
jgi:hypothetical protein